MCRVHTVFVDAVVGGINAKPFAADEYHKRMDRHAGVSGLCCVLASNCCAKLARACGVRGPETRCVCVRNAARCPEHLSP